MSLFNRKELVKCNTCHCLVEKADASTVEYASMFGGEYVDYYCGAHKKFYSQILSGLRHGLVHVDENGEPVGYVKVKPKKATRKPKKTY